MNILITAGPTREFIDDVRFLSNASSGLMGASLARAASDAGHTVTLALGPVEIRPVPISELVQFVSADDLRREVLARAPKADAIIMAAAVADYRPAERVRGKIKKTGSDLTLRLVPNPDILAELGRTKRPGQVLVGFALEAENARENALAKLRAKNLDLIVANSPAAIGAAYTSVELLFASGEIEDLADTPKFGVAMRVIEAVETLAATR